MRGKSLTILGVNPGTRYIGVAVFHGTVLKDWRIKVFRGKWSQAKLTKIGRLVLGLLRQYRPDALAIKALHPSKTSRHLTAVVNRIKAVVRKESVEVFTYSIKELEDFLCSGERGNKGVLAERVAAQHPELFPDLDRQKASRNLYHLRMFEAVALGLRCFHELDKH